MSDQQLRYLRNYQLRKYLILLVRILFISFFLIYWELASRKQWIDSFFFPAPSKLFFCFKTQMLQNHLLNHIYVTLLETFISFFCILVFSLIIATFLWRFQILTQIVEPFFITLNSLPKSALAPLIIVWLGTGAKAIIITGISVGIFGCIINLYTSFLETSLDKQKLIKAMGGKKSDIYFHVILPANRTAIFSNMKVNIGLSLVGIIIGEFLAAKKGLGYLILYSSQIFQIDLLLLCILLLCIIAFLLYFLLHLLEKRFL